MKPPIFARQPTPAEQRAIEQALRSSDAFGMRRAQIVRLSGEHGKIPRQIAGDLGCGVQTVRNVIRAFNRQGSAVLKRAPMGPKNPQRSLDATGRQRLLALMHQSPRAFGKPRSLWTLALLAEVAFQQGLTARWLSHETIRQALLALGISWRRAKGWISSPDGQYQLKKNKGIV